MSTETLWIVIAVVVAVLLIAVVVGLVVARKRRISLRDDEELETGEKEPPKGGSYKASSGFTFASGTATAPERPRDRGPDALPEVPPAGPTTPGDARTAVPATGDTTDRTGPAGGTTTVEPPTPPGTGTSGTATAEPGTAGTPTAGPATADTATAGTPTAGAATADTATADTATADTATADTATADTATDDTATADDVRTPPGGTPVVGGATEARTPPGGITVVDAPTPPRGTPVAPAGRSPVIDTAEASKDPVTTRLDTRTAGTAPTTPVPAGDARVGTAPADTAPADSAPTGTAPADTRPAETTAPPATTPSQTLPATPTTAPPADEAAPGAPTEEIAPAEGRLGRLRGQLSRSRSGLGQSLLGLLGAGQMDEESWEDVEATLLQADLGPEMTEEITTKLRELLASRGVRTAEQARTALRDVLTEALDTNQDRSVRALPHDGRPAVLLVVGVNGTGKTTTTGKLARVLVAGGHRVTLGAADTFRAAAAEQLVTWGERSGAGVVRGPEGSDPASVAFDAVKRGTADGVDAVLLDTAGRLHTKTGLMDELGKVKRVVEKQARVDEVLLVLDATTGQNGLTQARVFGDVVDVTGIALTKLDGTAKGGIVFRVQRELGVPVKLVGLGEGPDDLAPFEPSAFVDALLD